MLNAKSIVCPHGTPQQSYRICTHLRIHQQKISNNVTIYKPNLHYTFNKNMNMNGLKSTLGLMVNNNTSILPSHCMP